ncbi:kinase/pyrophosphorylase [Listeria grandensis]|uniref:Putative pyruvate, phosphate dikinase regulatory protein n=2 Tax=Listeria grandensis TaxID=1494963 RepID=W7BXE9_9LIST|nr:pyruvate, water dikinase regulatory protein [Listeria grandensis]EUJ24998.1 PEP synthetase regulatory protein [Listeria grandensis FSL F6-0971]MBC1473579.1 kinase/pyrophosphorylase [Listeria grandensis]MBC1934928.1 kinase/pyrophosphorylase [Listeria grandensis]MBC6315349.1 kinase/pyrophosphorylase [Listeria grandensis]
MTQPAVYVVSDSTGETAELVTRAALMQFGKSPQFIHRFHHVDTPDMIEEIVDLVAVNNGIIVHTIVVEEVRNELNKTAKSFGVPIIDIFGPLLAQLEETYQIKPLSEPGMVRSLDEAYFRKVAAIEFAVENDDGRNPRGLLQADYVLIGISRTSKTPLSQYLALKGLKVANVPIVPEAQVPDELFEIDPNKIIGLKISKEKLNQIREKRLASIGLSGVGNYASHDRIDEELEIFTKLTNKLGCYVLDVTNKAIEETANDILMHIGEIVDENLEL